MPTLRVLAVLELLQSHGQLSGAELARRVEVDPRTLRRYIAMLEEMGIPITTEQGRHGGYRLVPGYKLLPTTFTDEEAQAPVAGPHRGARAGLVRRRPRHRERAGEAGRRAARGAEEGARRHARERGVAGGRRAGERGREAPARAGRDGAVTSHRFAPVPRGRRYAHLARVRRLRPSRSALAGGTWSGTATCGRVFARCAWIAWPTASRRIARSNGRRGSMWADTCRARSPTLPRATVVEVPRMGPRLTAKRETFHTLGTIEAHPDGVLLRGSFDRGAVVRARAHAPAFRVRGAGAPRTWRTPWPSSRASCSGTGGGARAGTDPPGSAGAAVRRRRSRAQPPPAASPAFPRPRRSREATAGPPANRP